MNDADKRFAGTMAACCLVGALVTWIVAECVRRWPL
jgi:hypothetical protein